jgi:hypothetical protein
MERPAKWMRSSDLEGMYKAQFGAQFAVLFKMNVSSGIAHSAFIALVYL